MPLKKLIFLSVFVFISSSSFSQGLKLWDLGVRAGFTYSSIQYSAEDTAATEFVDAVGNLIEYKPGFSVGVFSDIYRIKNIYIGVGADYYQKGYRAKVAETNEMGVVINNGHLNYRMDYLTFSLYGKFSPNAGKIKPYFIVAPRIDYYMGYSMSTSNLSHSFSGNNILLDDYKKITGSVSFGAGVEIFGILTKPVLIEFMYNPDLINQFNNGIVSVKNKSFGINAGVQF
ncbi:MAG TPA: porin family protein [Ignavibacteria bacterium]|nr:porin family protein [Ignavibacteria bacterium]